MHYVYAINVKDEIYYGYTSRKPQIRIDEHIKIARLNKWTHNSLLYPALVAANLRHSWTILVSTPKEEVALLAEIKYIAEAKNSLNLSRGGEGSTINVKTITKPNGNVELIVVPKKKSTKPKKISYRRYSRKRKNTRKRGIRYGR